jgi:hypothetical protein
MTLEEILTIIRSQSDAPEKVIGKKMGNAFWVYDMKYLYICQGGKTERGWRPQKKYPNPTLLIQSFKQSMRRAIRKGEVNLETIDSRWDELIQTTERFMELLNRFLGTP